MDDAAALAALCRWADDGTVRLENTLDRYLLTALQRGIINPEMATSLALIIGGAAGDLRKDLVARAAENPLHYRGIIEELAKETLLFLPQHGRLNSGEEIVEKISTDISRDGDWLELLRKTVELLKQPNFNKSEESATDLQDNVLSLDNGRDYPKEFEFDPQGRSFTTPESIAEVLQEAETSGLRHHDGDLLRRMRDASSHIRDRVSFLSALANVPDDAIWESTRIDLLRDTLDAWKGTPAVDRWCIETLPSVLVTHFYGATRWLKEGDAALHKLLDHTGLDVEGRLRIFLAGVAKAGEALNSRALFAIAEEIARALDEGEAGEQLSWYTERLRNRLPAVDHALCILSDIPQDPMEAVARFLFALMSDIDTRVRWKSAHALRCMANLGCYDVVEATILQSSRVKDVAFRDPTAPFYFLAAKLWLAISLHRISSETPEALSACKDQIFDLATSSELPHVGIREYAKRTLIQLESAGVISLTSKERDKINRVNTALKGESAGKQSHSRTFSRTRSESRRFKFDDTDTIPYWFNPILRIFPTASQDDILDMAERWIIDEWEAHPKANYWDMEPRKGRYSERGYALWSHRHGSFPIVERYGRHLEWNAVYCVVGELLNTHPISSNEEDYFDRFDYWLEKVLPTEISEWLVDNRGATPLEPRMWQEDPRSDKGWVNNVSRQEFLAEAGVSTPYREGWIVVKGDYSVYFAKRETTIRIGSALVSPESGSALARALQSERNIWGLRLPNENDDLQINSYPYCLLGWLSHMGGDLRFDDNDPFRYDVGQIRATPGRKPEEALGLVPLVSLANCNRAWICNDTGEAVFIYEAWCDEPAPEDDYYPRRIRSSGWRLWANVEKIQNFLAEGGWDLISEVQIERELRKEYGRAYESAEKEKTHNKILLLKADGSIADAKGRIGTWSGISQRAGS